MQALEGVRERLQQNGDGATSRHHARRKGIERGMRSRGRCAGKISSNICRSDCHRCQKKQRSGVMPTSSFSKTSRSIPFSPEEILAMGQQEWNRAVAFEAYEKERNKDVPPLQLANRYSTAGSKMPRPRNCRFANSSTSTAFSPCPIGCSITLCGRCRNICACLDLAKTTTSLHRRD